MSHVDTYLEEVERICGEIDRAEVERLAIHLRQVRGRSGRLFIAGLGGSAANASHAANDFRKLCGIEAYCLSDNVAELTARANDEGWETIYSGALAHATVNDALFVLSVGGGTQDVSVPLVNAVKKARELGMFILGIVGRDGGYTKQHGDCVVVVPTVEPERVTPHTEGMQMVVIHCLVSHPTLQRNPTKW